MRKAAATVILPVLAVALLAAVAALWPSGALAGPPAQTEPGTPSDGGGQIAQDPEPAKIQGLDFAAFPRSGDYTAGENIRVAVKFDHNCKRRTGTATGSASPPVQSRSTAAPSLPAAT